jgi:hypothetical protein
MSKVKGLIVDCCELPLSVVIIGVGECDFTLMEELNGNDNRLEDDNGRVATRDLVGFVEFKKYKNDSQILT